MGFMFARHRFGVRGPSEEVQRVEVKNGAQPGCSSGPESFASWPLSSRSVGRRDLYEPI